jgi:hypothetical protein
MAMYLLSGLHQKAALPERHFGDIHNYQPGD